MSRYAGPLRQIGIVTRDANATMKYWAEVMGVGPFFVRPELEFEEYRYYGKPSRAPIIKCALGHSAGLQIEIIQQLNDAPSAYLDFLKGGREGFQHMSSWFDNGADFDRTYNDLKSRDFEIALEGRMSAFDLRYAYFISKTHSGQTPLLEISDSLKVKEVRAMFEELERLNKDWDGSNPIRELAL